MKPHIIATALNANHAPGALTAILLRVGQRVANKPMPAQLAPVLPITAALLLPKHHQQLLARAVA